MWTFQRGESTAGLCQPELYSSKIEILMQDKRTQVFCSERVAEKVGQNFK